MRAEFRRNVSSLSLIACLTDRCSLLSRAEKKLLLDVSK
jgi:hypothetical protein